MKYLMLLCLGGMLLVYCKRPAPRSNPVDSVSTLPTHPPEVKTDSLLIIPDTATIEAGIFNKKENMEPGKEEYHFCEKWNLDSSTIVAIVRGFTPINGTTWHYGYDNFDCELVGYVKISGKPYKMYLNAGSYFFLTTPNEQYIFGDEKNAFNKYFLEGNIYDAYLEDR